MAWPLDWHDIVKVMAKIPFAVELDYSVMQLGDIDMLIISTSSYKYIIG